MQLIKGFDLLVPGDAQKLMMLMHIHFPALLNEHISVDKARGKVVVFLRDPKDSKLTAKEFVEAQEKFEAACAEFKSKISALAQEQ